MKKIVAFDWDGTLCDSRERHRLLLDDILQKRRINIDTSNLMDFKRLGKNNVDFLISNGVNETTACEIQKEWIEHIEDQKYLEHDCLKQGALFLLNEYSANDLILITARRNEEALFNQVGRLGVNNFFYKIFVVSPGKCAAEEKAKILIEQKATLMIGDTYTDFKAAQIAGVDFQFVENGFHNKETAEGA